ncbi:hypothetical protein ACFYY3_32965 [Streptomyces sp. NPDC001812]|uniref:hypothetical protein n=1 Tax=unclassified Streptomyces TaxID=2593676 RepID=UPI003665718B
MVRGRPYSGTGEFITDPAATKMFGCTIERGDTFPPVSSEAEQVTPKVSAALPALALDSAETTDGSVE